jgi:hypothetical protein
MFDYTTQQQMIASAMEQFPATFGLRNVGGLHNPTGHTFRISLASSYVNDSGEVQLYTEILIDGKWLSYAKGTIAELKREIVPIRPSISRCFKVEFRQPKTGIIAAVFVAANNREDATTKALEAMEGANFIHQSTIGHSDTAQQYL